MQFDRPTAAEYLEQADAARRQQAFEKAVALYRTALQQEPKLAIGHFRLAECLRAMGLKSRVIYHYQVAVALAPTNADFRFKLGVALHEARRYSQALEAYNYTVKLRHDHLEARLRAAVLLLRMGKFEEGRRELRDLAGVATDASNVGEVHYRLAECTKYEAGDPHIPEMEALLAGDTMSRISRRNLHFALAKAYDDVGAFDQAFAHCRRANETEKSRFDRDAHERFVSAQIDFFSEGFFHERPAGASGSEKPVLIVGMPRSGTTLVGRILAAHPAVHSAGELIVFRQMAEQLPRLLQSRETYPRVLEGLSERTALGLSGAYIKSLSRTASSDAVRLLDDYPENFLFLGLVGLLFPRARIIHCRRDPLDTCLSVYMRRLDPMPNGDHAYGDDIEDLAFYYRQYERLMSHWRAVIPNSMLDLRYERLVADQEQEVRRIIDFAGLEWSNQCLSFHDSGGVVSTSSVWQVRQPLYRSSVGRWRHYRKYLQTLSREFAARDASER